MHATAATETTADAARDSGTIPVLLMQDGCATIRLNRPREHNRIAPEDLLVLDRYLSQLDADPAPRVVVLTGTGSRSFSSGYSLQSLRDGVVAPDAPDVSLESVINKLEDLRVPTICALNGSVYGGSIDLALACDFRIGVADAVLQMPAARIGLHYYANGMRRYVERLGLGAAKQLLLTARRFDAADMLRLGVLDEVVSADLLQATVAARVAEMAALAPAALAGMKSALNAIARGVFDAPAIHARYQASLASDDLAEGLAALAEKRAPVFR